MKALSRPSTKQECFESKLAKRVLSTYEKSFADSLDSRGKSDTMNS